MKPEQNMLTDVSSLMSKDYALKCKCVLNSDLYVLDIDISKGQDACIAASFSNNNFEVLELETLQSKCCVKTQAKEGTSALRFSHNPVIIYSSTKDGYINAWDIRQNNNKPCLKFDSSGDEELKPINTFDFDDSESFLIAGSDLVGQDSYLLFWDCRSTKLLGGYWESHTDDITQVAFQPGTKNMIASGSTDGLINIFDITQKCEDDALINTLNTESSVSKLKWIDGILSCITNTEVVQLWDWKEVELKSSFERDKIKDCLGTTVNVEYFINTFSFSANNSVLLASGTHSGGCKLWDVSEKTVSLFSALDGGHLDVIRCLQGHQNLNVFVSGGEDGAICIWKLKDPNEDASRHLKDKSTIKERVILHSQKPY